MNPISILTPPILLLKNEVWVSGSSLGWGLTPPLIWALCIYDWCRHSLRNSKCPVWELHTAKNWEWMAIPLARVEPPHWQKCWIRLKFLNIERNCVGLKEATVMAEILKQNQTLEKLYLFYDFLSPEGPCTLVDSLQYTTPLWRWW